MKNLFVINSLDIDGGEKLIMRVFEECDDKIEVIKDINLLTKLKKMLKEDCYIIKDIIITAKNNKIYFSLLKISPIFLAFLYNIKVKLSKVQRGLLNEN